jgi:hypothetical protein
MISQAYEDFLKSYYIQEGNDIIKYNTLSEENKEMFSKQIVAAIVKSIEDRSYALDNKMIDTSKGDLTKLENYSYIQNSLELLNNMQASSDQKIPFLNDLNDAHKNIIAFKDDFEKGYKLKKEVIQIFYAEIVLALIESISFVIAVSIDYIKDPLGNFESSVKYNIEKLNKYPTVNIECLQKFNGMAVNGDLKLFFTTVYTNKKSSINEDSVFIDLLSAGLSLISEIGWILAIIARFIPSIPEILRMLVSMSYAKKVATADYLRLQAQYIELNIARQNNLENPNTKAIKKQEKIMKKLIKLADKIDIDQKTTSKAVRNDIEKQNKNISNNIKSSSNNTDGQQSINSTEQIIL